MFFKRPQLHQPTRPRIFNPITRFFMWASKTDVDLVSLATWWARSTQVAMGFFVCVTAALAFVAAYYTVGAFTTNQVLTVSLAVGWMIFIFFADREIVGYLNIDNRSASPMWFRILLALGIGISVAIPMELMLFQERIDQQIKRKYLDDNKDALGDYKARENQLDGRRQGLQKQLSELRSQQSSWGKIMDDEIVGRATTGRSGLSGEGPAFRNAQEQQLAVRRQMQDTRNDLAALEKDQQRADSQFTKQETPQITNFVTRYEAMDAVTSDSWPLRKLSWLITLVFILIDVFPAVMKTLTPFSDYIHLVVADMRENIARVDAISDRNYSVAVEDPTWPEPSVAEKFSRVRFSLPPAPEERPTPSANKRRREREAVYETTRR